MKTLTESHIIGMRTAKTMLAVFLALAVTYVLDRPYPMYAAIATIIAMSSTVFNSIEQGKNRLIGTCLGAFIGYLCLLIDPDNPLLAALGVGIVIFICNTMQINKSIAISSMVFLSVFIGSQGSQLLYYTVNRLLDTSIGIIIAVLVNLLIYPPNLHKKIKEEEIEVKENITMVLTHIITCSEDHPCYLETLETNCRKLRDNIKAYEKEVKVSTKKDEEVFSIRERVFLYWDIIENFKDIFKVGVFHKLDKENLRLTEELGLEVSQDRFSEDKELEVVFNYHLTQALVAMRELHLFETDYKTLKENHNESSGN